jgi:broad specificity phosphatase PhoE
MTETRFWLIRHATVEEAARLYLYGTMDVALCAETLAAQGALYRGLAGRLPRPARWLVSPLSRTVRTAEAIFRAGYPVQPLTEEPGLIEQNFGAWQGLPNAELPARLTEPAHPFWTVAATERPPNGESIEQVVLRVGAMLERLAAAWPGEDLVAVSHGGAIRAAVAHALGIGGEQALRFSVFNLSLTRLERQAAGWRVVCVNEAAGP